MTFRLARAGAIVPLCCVLALLGASAVSAEQVYPGCAVPAAAPKHVFYIDPVNGSADGDGSKSRPWNSLQAVFAPVGRASPLLSTMPYPHISDDKKRVMTPNSDAPIKPGDAIELMSGNYGDLLVHLFANAIDNSDFVTIEAAPGQTPVMTLLYVSGTNKWRFRGLKIQALKKDWKPLVLVGPDGANPVRDIIFDGLSISSQDDVSGWTQEEWRTRARDGVSIRGGDKASCTAFLNSKIFNVATGVAFLAGDRTLFANNVINNFGEDGLDYGANDLIIAHNMITNNNDLGDNNHNDGMQGQSVRLPGIPSNQYSNILIDSNVVIRQTDPNLKFPVYLQGIDAFDEDWHNVTVSNNLIVTSACWGITYGSLHDGKIVNNTVLADNLLPMPGDCKPLIAVADKTHEGSSSNDVIVRNNIANGFSVDNRDSNIVMDHNVCATIKGYCRILSYVDGKPRWDVTKPGFHGDHNLIDEQGAETEFVNLDPAKLVYDLRLKPRAQAIGVGSPAEAPKLDIRGAVRGTPVDAGAYDHNPEAAAAK